jgi:hypothetical protein
MTASDPRPPSADHADLLQRCHHLLFVQHRGLEDLQQEPIAAGVSLDCNSAINTFMISCSYLKYDRRRDLDTVIYPPKVFRYGQSFPDSALRDNHENDHRFSNGSNQTYAA